MASGWLWQGASEAPAHCVFHYPSAPPVPVPPPSCFSHASNENTYSFSASYGFASVAPTYPVFSAQCVRVTFVSKSRVLCEQTQGDGSRTASKFKAPDEPLRPDPAIATAPDTAPCASQPPAAARSVTMVPSSACDQNPSSRLPEREHDKGDGKRCFTYPKRLCRIRPRSRQSKQALARETVKWPQARPGAGQSEVQECAAPDRWVVLARPRRVTKRVGGVKTPQPYQRRRRSLIQRHLLQIPG